MRLPPLVVSDTDRGELERRVRSHTTPQRDVTRARIVLLAAEGHTNRAIASQVGLHHNQVGLWRQRYAAAGLAGLAEPKRPGRPVVYDHDDRLAILKTITQTRPPGQSLDDGGDRSPPGGRGRHLGLAGVADLPVP